MLGPVRDLLPKMATCSRTHHVRPTEQAQAKKWPSSPGPLHLIILPPNSPSPTLLSHNLSFHIWQGSGVGKDVTTSLLHAGFQHPFLAERLPRWKFPSVLSSSLLVHRGKIDFFFSCPINWELSCKEKTQKGFPIPWDFPWAKLGVQG